MIAVTTGAAREKYAKDGDYHYTVPELLRPFEVTGNLIGIRYLEPFAVYGVMQHLSDEELEQSARNYAAYALS